jgi:hypothetical protein
VTPTPSTLLTAQRGFGADAVTGKPHPPAEHPSTIQNTPGEFLIAFVLYTDTLLSINQIVPLLDRAYKTVFESINDVEAVVRGFPTVWNRIDQTIDGATQVDENQQVCSGFKYQDRTDCPVAGRLRADEHAGVVNRAMR